MNIFVVYNELQQSTNGQFSVYPCQTSVAAIYRTWRNGKPGWAGQKVNHRTNLGQRLRGSRRLFRQSHSVELFNGKEKSHFTPPRNHAQHIIATSTKIKEIRKNRRKIKSKKYGEDRSKHELPRNTLAAGWRVSTTTRFRGKQEIKQREDKGSTESSRNQLNRFNQCCNRKICLYRRNPV